MSSSNEVGILEQVYNIRGVFLPDSAERTAVVVAGAAAWRGHEAARAGPPGAGAPSAALAARAPTAPLARRPAGPRSARTSVAPVHNTTLLLML